MSTNKKYAYQLEQIDTIWNARITRKVTSKKTVISKQKTGFSSESEAKDWAEKMLSEFTDTQSSSNKRHGETRQQNIQIKQNRSARRAEKTAAAKSQVKDLSSNASEHLD